jgi:hypothetical protein
LAHIQAKLTEKQNRQSAAAGVITHAGNKKCLFEPKALKKHFLLETSDSPNSTGLLFGRVDGL